DAGSDARGIAIAGDGSDASGITSAWDWSVARGTTLIDGRCIASGNTQKRILMVAQADAMIERVQP
ncbi:hypothetical protein K4M05_10035, partial [Pseudomonas syringae pv. tomato]|uniref:hypothetical protein n=1 Tax=Pseudomonas syringae group genomosp. 3 TaxID=251701 RepID=UPI0035C8FCD3|nr:hypothetical protein [Pseudomonas syringae pv. tomato]